MVTIIGTIEEISHSTIPEKVIVTVIPEAHERVYVEFKGKRAALAVAYKKNDNVQIAIRFNGKKSKLGKRYNNIEGRSIKRA